MQHTLKIWPEPFRAVLSGEKRYEVRKADRPFSVGDIVKLEEWDPATQDYTGKNELVIITYLTHAGTWGLPSELCVFGFRTPIMLASPPTVKQDSVG